jgi:hypothetical protein
VSQFEKLRSDVEREDHRRQQLVRLGALGGGIAVAAILAVSTGFRLSDWHNWWHRPQTPPTPPTAVRPPVIPAPATVKNLRHDGPKARLGTDASASKIPLRLLLVRTLPGQTVHAGQALLGTDRDHPQTYLAGAILENGARLDEIYRDHVVLVKGTHRVSLYVTATSTSESTSKADALSLVGGPAAAIGSPHLSVEPVTDFLRPVPVYRNGVIAGFQIYPGSRAALFAKWGLQSGDVLTDLEGQPVSDADQLMNTLRSLLDGEALTATVQRAGAPVTITLDGSDVERLRTASNMPPAPPVGPASP